ncbi:MAG: DNA polymerase III subunit delta [Myxococcota bacterium]|nr:DNA polymerase III subunit delta [Myxococcota bacterium]
MAASKARRTRANQDPLGHLKKDGPLPVYILHGEERLLVQEALEELKLAGLPPTAVDFNLDVFLAKDTTATKIADAARMLPAFAPRRMVIVKDADKLKADTLNDLQTYLDDPSPTTTLIFVGHKFDARTKFYKSIKKVGAAIKFDHPNLRQLPRLIRDRATKMNIDLRDGAVHALVDSVGADLGGLVSALEKVALYVGPDSGKPVTANDVESVVSHVREESIFELTDAVGTKNLPVAFKLVHQIVNVSRNHPLALLGLVASHWRRLTVTRAMLADRAPKGDIEAALSLPPFVVEKIMRQARNQTLPRLVLGLRAIAEADQALKGGRLPPIRVMESLVLRLC